MSLIVMLCSVIYILSLISLIQANMPKEIADYLNKMGARIPQVKPGKATIEYLTKIQASTRFWGKILSAFSMHAIYLLSLSVHFSSLTYYGNYSAGGLLLSVLATTSTILDHYLRRINEGFSIGFTSILIIVSSLLSYSSLAFQRAVSWWFMVIHYSSHAILTILYTSTSCHVLNDMWKSNVINTLYATINHRGILHTCIVLS